MHPLSFLALLLFQFNNVQLVLAGGKGNNTVATWFQFNNVQLVPDSGVVGTEVITTFQFNNVQLVLWRHPQWRHPQWRHPQWRHLLRVSIQ